MEQKIIVSGNPDYGLAKAIAKRFEARFCSRVNGYDFYKEESRKAFAEECLDYNVFICCAALWRFNQALLLEDVYKAWRSVQKEGQIICLGSTADTHVKPSDWMYPIEKKAVRAYCRNLSLGSLGGHGHKPPGIRVTYLSPGYLDTPSMNKKQPDVDKIDTDYLAGIIEWVLQQPKNINISEIALDPIQLSETGARP